MSFVLKRSSLTIFRRCVNQGCQMVSFQTKYTNLGKFWRALGGKMLIYILGLLGIFMDIWVILWPFGTFRVHLVHYFWFWYHVPRKIWQPWRQLFSNVSVFFLRTFNSFDECFKKLLLPSFPKPHNQMIIILISDGKMISNVTELIIV
jgi:hypothetical protein